MKTKQVNTISISISILFLTVAWGFSWPVMKIGLEDIGPFTFSFLRFLIGGIVLIIFLFFLSNKEEWKKLTSLHWGHVITLGLLQTFAVFGLITYAMLYVDAGKTSIVLYTMPIWSSILASLFLKETLSKKNIVGLLLGVAGLAFIIGTDIFQQASWQNTIGISLILIAAICWAVSNVYFRLKLAGSNQMFITTFQMLIGTAGLLVLAVIFEGGQSIRWSASSIFSVLFTGVVASAICFSLWYYLLTVINTVTAAISMLLVPVFGVLFGYLLLDESLTIPMIAGGLFILLGIFISQAELDKIRPFSKRKKHAA
ncbi:EamA-like transporter family protein [Alteribacillus persepolensis]|uniref:EamA-like transporter family protein n=1 Tax=Alteribacillus persepolensis TaxID=568899 RepID=A0A1G8C6W8_9BACI|nr:DMT family transporter [Alteribacillus persepolensis]SDH41108.1 EamA-like transporter family protein [Alteribacillus persepolensis]